MKTNANVWAALAFTFGVILQLHAQGYIVPNGVTYLGQTSLGYETHVLQNPTNSNYTGFVLNPIDINTFSFFSFTDEGVRVFVVSENDPISLQPILANSYTELTYPNSYVFPNGSFFYLGFYTGENYPQNGVYSDPLFGWGEFWNNNGAIQMLDSALEYQGGGIYAGTQNIIPVPEPGEFVLAALGVSVLGYRRW